MTEMSPATAAVMARIQAAETGLVIPAPAAVVPTWLSAGRGMVKLLGRSSPLPGAVTGPWSRLFGLPAGTITSPRGPFGAFQMCLDSPIANDCAHVGDKGSELLGRPRPRAGWNRRSDHQAAAVAPVDGRPQRGRAAPRIFGRREVNVARKLTRRFHVSPAVGLIAPRHRSVTELTTKERRFAPRNSCA
jgi:hypothetical protein